MLATVVTSTGEARAKVGDVLAERWELRELVGAGGLGRVFFAWDRERRQTCALKLFDGAAPPAEAFRRYSEALRSAAAVAHPALVVSQTPAAAGGPRFVVGEALKGFDLDGLRARGGPVHWSRAAEIVSGCADALAAVHEATGLAHRALKPGNVWITEASQVRVLDLGIAELAVTSVAPRPGGVFVEYRAPEQVEGGPGDARSDVFTLAVLLFEMATGVHPFTGVSTFKAAHRALQSAPELTTAGLPTQARPLLARALARRPEERFAGARELVRALTIVRQSVGSAVPRATAAKHEPAADEPAAAPPVVDSTTQIRIPVQRLRPPITAPVGGLNKDSAFAAPVAPATADAPASPASDEPALLGFGDDPPAASARRAPAKPPPSEVHGAGLPRGGGSERDPPRPAEPETTMALPEVRGVGQSRGDGSERDSRRPAEPETTMALPEVRGAGQSRRDGSERDPPRPAEPETTMALPELDRAPGRPSAGDEDAATIALPTLRPRAGREDSAHGDSNMSSGTDGVSDEMTVAMPGRRPRDRSVSDDMSERTVAVATDRTLAPTGADDRSGRPAPRPGESTLALSGSHPVLTRAGESPAPHPASSNMPLRTSGIDSPEESTQVVTNLGEQVVAAAARSRTTPPAAESSWISPRALITLNVVLGALILAAIIVLLLR